IGERNVGHPRAYAAAADWTTSRLRQARLQVHEESYAAGQTVARNIVGEIPGAGANDQVVVIGAHYDSVEGTPGANDNASGVAALLALGAALREKPAPAHAALRRFRQRRAALLPDGADGQPGLRARLCG